MSTQEKTPTPSRGVPVTLDRVRYFRYTLKALRAIREEFGDNALKEGVSGEKLAKVLWLGLVGDDPSLTPELVEEMIDMEHLDDVTAAMKKAMGQKSKVESVPPQPAEPVGTAS